MGVMKRVDRVSERPHQHERGDDQQLVGCFEGFDCCQLNGNGAKDHHGQHEADRKQHPAVRVILLGCAAQLNSAEFEQGNAGPEERQRGDVEPGEESALESRERRQDRPAGDQQRQEDEEAHRRNPVADGLDARHGLKLAAMSRAVQRQKGDEAWPGSG